MKNVAKLALGALLMMGTATAVTAPASAGVGFGVSFGWDGPGYVPFGDPCAYYDYYDAPPPWGLPPDYCEYPVYFGPVYWGDMWYRGPIYYRWNNGYRLYWINGGWRRDQWRGGAMPSVRWDDRGGFRGGVGRGGREGGQGWSGPRGGHYGSGSGFGGGAQWLRCGTGRVRQSWRWPRLQRWFRRSRCRAGRIW